MQSSSPGTQVKYLKPKEDKKNYVLHLQEMFNKYLLNYVFKYQALLDSFSAYCHRRLSPEEQALLK